MNIRTNIINTQPTRIVFRNRNIAEKQVVTKSCSFLDEFLTKKSNTFSRAIIKDLKGYISSKNGLIKESDIKGIVGQGGLSTVFDLGNNEVLKCSLENPLEHRKHNSNFDIPFLGPVEKFGETYFVKEVKADTENVTRADCKDVIQRIYDEGFEPSRDFDEYKTRQVGYYKGKPYLLDTRAALPRPNAFSEYIYKCCDNYRCIYHLNTMRAEDIIREEAERENLVKKEGLRALHVDETPRRNLSFKEGIKLVERIVQENIDYNRWNKFDKICVMLYTTILASIYKLMDKLKP